MKKNNQNNEQYIIISTSLKNKILYEEYGK